MEIEIEFTRKDYLEFNKYYYFKKRIKRALIVPAFFVLLWLILLNFNRPFNPILILIELVVFSLAWGVFMFISYKLSLIRISRMPDEKGEIIGEKTYILSDDGLKEISKNGESFIKWIGVKSLEENENYVFIFIDKIMAHVIPKRYFSDTLELQEFMSILKSNIKI